ncbi:MAG: FtsZ-binding cell division protein ZapB [Halioglobus sp.]|jgi:FtsZ-binding cell division protein ZapB
MVNIEREIAELFGRICVLEKEVDSLKEEKAALKKENSRLLKKVDLFENKLY